MIRKEDEATLCDFCDKELSKKDFPDFAYLWSFGQRGIVIPLGGVSGFMSLPAKHSCPTELCKAKLLVWARS